jgi:hypothetical protein
MPPPDDSFALSHSKLGIVRDQRASSLSWRSTKVVIAATMRVPQLPRPSKNQPSPSGERVTHVGWPFAAGAAKC